MRLAHFGTFDVPNYGDLLFPRIAEYRLGDMFDEIVHVSPAGGAVYRDVARSISFADFLKSRLVVDAVMVGGGNILHANGTTLAEYSSVKQSAYPSLWLGAAQVAARQNVPLVMNAPGAPRTFGRLGAPLVRRALSYASYRSVRDHHSEDVLKQAGVNEVHVVPDSALEIARWFGAGPPDALDVTPEIAAALQGRVVSIHVNDRYATSNPADLAASIDEVGETLRAKPVLIAIGPCHGDDIYARQVARHMRTAHAVYDAPRGVEDIAFVISRSVAYVGSSMHGFITAASYSVPALLVASHAAQHKFDGLLSHLSANDRLMDGWPDAAARLRRPLAPVGMDGARRRIDEHWNRLRIALRERPANGESNVLLRAPINLSSAFELRTLRSR